MKKYMLIGFLSMAMVLGLMESARAAIQTQELFRPNGILDLALFVGAAFCLWWSARVMSLVKGGLMSKGWQMFSLGFGFLLLARLLAIGETIKLATLPNYIPAAVYLVMVVIWSLGLYQTRKVLG